MNFTAILYRISESDEKAFKELFEHFLPGLLSFSISILRNKQLAEEVVEDVFVKLWSNRKDLTNINSISHYLYKAVRYASINALEKEKRDRSISIDNFGDAFTFSYSVSNNELSFINKENCLKISNAIDQLPPKCKLIFRLIKEEGMKYRDVSKVLNLSEKTIEAQMNIAVKKLLLSLKDDFPELGAYFSAKK